MRILLAALAATVAAATPAAKIQAGIQPFGAVEVNGALWVALISDSKVAKIDPATNRVVARVKTGFGPFAVAYGAGSLWTANSQSGTVTRIDPRKNKVLKTIKVGGRPYDIAFGAGAIWVGNNGGTVNRINPKANKLVKTIKAGSEPNGIVFAFGAVWTGDRLGNKLLKIDPATNKITATLKLDAPDWVTPDENALWVSEETGSVVRVDPASLQVTATVKVGANPLHSAVVDGDLWVPNLDDSTISVVDRGTGKLKDTFPGPAGAIAITRAAGDVWVSGSTGTEVWRFRPSG
jgi:YVTN family beta-propeller protein